MANKVLKVPKGKLLPAKGQWKNRFEVRSATSNRVYIVSQHKTKGHWGCSCRGWINHRKCKHLTALGLPPFEKPHKIKVMAA